MIPPQCIYLNIAKSPKLPHLFSYPQTKSDKYTIRITDKRKLVSLINNAGRSEYYAFGAAGTDEGLIARMCWASGGNRVEFLFRGA
jgi:hypothetical protein